MDPGLTNLQLLKTAGMTGYSEFSYGFASSMNG